MRNAGRSERKGNRIREVAWMDTGEVVAMVEVEGYENNSLTKAQ